MLLVHRPLGKVRYMELDDERNRGVVNARHKRESKEDVPRIDVLLD